MTAKQFRDRALECRAIAKSVPIESDAAMLEEIAGELDAEADRIEATQPQKD